MLVSDPNYPVWGMLVGPSRVQPGQSSVENGLHLLWDAGAFQPKRRLFSPAHAHSGAWAADGSAYPG